MTETELDTGPGTDAAHDALVSLCNDLVNDIATARSEAAVRQALLALSAAPDPPRDWRTLGPSALGFAKAAADPVVPDRAGHEDHQKHCEICGSTRTPLVAGIDGPQGAWVCADGHERECEARQLKRFPPRPDRVPEAFLTALEREDEIRAARHQQPLAGQQEPPEQQQEPAGQQLAVPPGWQMPTANGTYDQNGQWRPPVSYTPPVPRYDPWQHTMRNPQHRQHLVGPVAADLYGHHGYLIDTGGADSPQGGQQEPERDTSTGIPPAGPAPGQQQAAAGVRRDEAGHPQAGSDARGEQQGSGIDTQVIPPRHPAAVVQRPARDRFGSRRKLRYQGRR